MRLTHVIYFYIKLKHIDLLLITEYIATKLNLSIIYYNNIPQYIVFLKY